MSAADVVEAVDALKEGLCDLLTGRPIVPPDELSFYSFEEGLDSGIVVAVSLAAHRNIEAQLPQSPLIIVRAILTASVRMMDAVRRRISKCQCPVQSLQNQVPFQPITLVGWIYLFAGNGSLFTLGQRHFNLSKLRNSLLCSKFFPGHLVFPFQFNNPILSSSEKADRVNLLSTPQLYYCANVDLARAYPWKRAASEWWKANGGQTYTTVTEGG